MSKENKFDLKSFLVQEGYLIVFAFICLFVFGAYFYFDLALDSNKEVEIVDTSAVRGVWIQGGSSLECPKFDNFDYQNCVEGDFLERYREIEPIVIDIDSRGTIIFSNEDLLISGIFTKRSSLDSQSYLGDLSIRINQRYFVYNDIVLNNYSTDFLKIYPKSDGYLIVFMPPVNMTGLVRRVWLFEYSHDEELRKLSFNYEDSLKSFVEISDILLLKRDNKFYIMNKIMDPSLMGNIFLEIFTYDDRIEILDTLLLKENI